MGVAEKQGSELFLADATLYLEFFGIIVIAWQWLLQAVAASNAMKSGVSQGDSLFYQGKIFTCKYFFKYELPKIQGLSIRLRDSDGLTIDMKTEYF